jgi:LmbE family N-acetylglucosaminyl deacetylase
MQFSESTAEVYVPDALPVPEALARTTHLAIAAHQDDLEIMAFTPILECFQNRSKWFSGVVVTNGSGSPRDGVYAQYSDAEMIEVRRKEQKKAAMLGEYGVQVLLDHSSAAIKDGVNSGPRNDIRAIIEASRPDFVYTHNLADKHDTHVAVTLRVIEAIRAMPKTMRPKALYGCEVWRDLDWLVDTDKVSFDCSHHQGLQVALLGVFDSQIAGGKRYDLATMGRRTAHATYFASHATDVTTGMNFGMDLTPLITDDSQSPWLFVSEHIQRFADDVASRIRRSGA